MGLISSQRQTSRPSQTFPNTDELTAQVRQQQDAWQRQGNNTTRTQGAQEQPTAGGSPALAPTGTVSEQREQPLVSRPLPAQADVLNNQNQGGGLIPAETGGPMLPAPSTPATTPATTEARRGAGEAGGAGKWVVDDAQTVSGNIDRIIGQDSALMQRARTQGMQAANKRGLINSSMAIGEAQDAVYNAALPIAQGDASVRAEAGKFNASEANDFGQIRLQGEIESGLTKEKIAGEKDIAKLNADLQMDLQAAKGNLEKELANLDSQLKKELLAAQTTADKEKLQMQFDNNKALLAQEYENKLTLTRLDNENKLMLEDIKAKNASTLQTSVSATALFNTAMTNLTSIMKDENMDAESKQNAINGIVQTLDASLTVVSTVNSVDLGDMLDDGAVEDTVAA